MLKDFYIFVGGRRVLKFLRVEWECCGSGEKKVKNFWKGEFYQDALGRKLSSRHSPSLVKPAHVVGSLISKDPNHYAIYTIYPNHRCQTWTGGAGLV